MGDDNKLATFSVFITLILFIILIIVVCATIIPELYNIDDNTSQLNPGGVISLGLDQLHEDLLVVQAQLNLAAGLLIGINASTFALANP